MPQMSPLMWLILYVYFIILLFFFNIMIYYMKILMISYKKKNLNLKFSLKWYW